MGAPNGCSEWALWCSPKDKQEMLDWTPDPISLFHVSRRLGLLGTSHSHRATIFLLDCIWEAQEAPQNN